MRLFTQLLLAFALVIAFSVGATALLLNLRVRQTEARYRLAAINAVEQTIAASLADYYVAHGMSWAGIEQRLDDTIQGWPGGSSVSYALYDEAGRLLTRGGAALPAGGLRPRQGQAIEVEGRRVGAFVLQPSLASMRALGTLNAQRQTVGTAQTLEQQLRPSFVFVALVTGGIALLLAVAISRRISAPLAGITDAARSVAAGRLQVEAPGSSIAEVRELSAAFNRMASELSRADELRRSLTADIAHELRTPLSVLRGKLEGMLDGVYAATPSELNQVLDEVTLLERLTDDLRVLSLAEAGQLPLHRQPVAVAELLHDARASFAATGAQQQVAIELGALAEATVEVDEQRMQQVIGNVITNALRHTPPGGAITLSSERQGDAVALRIADTGSGISAADLPHIFDRFWRGDRARSRQGSSTGLGLAIARQLVEAHHGTISAASSPDAGTTISIQLPCVA